MNEKGSTTKEGLENYFMNHFARLFPDKADLPGYSVAVLIDGGLARSHKFGDAHQAVSNGHFIASFRPPKHYCTATNHGSTVWSIQNCISTKL
jgi:hypothetical protein